MDNISKNVGDVLLIKLVEPYTNISKILSYEDVVEGETTTSYYIRYFRWSTTNKTFSDWEFLTTENLQSITIDPSKDFWIQYKYEVDSLDTGHQLEFMSISLEVVNEQGAIVEMPCIEFCGEDCPPNSNLIIDDCCDTNQFKPYDLSAGLNNYNQLSALVSNIFGFPATYYKTGANKNSEDVILKEYSLYNVTGVDTVNIMFPDNEFPTREIAFKKDHIEIPDEMFEIHIVKDAFECAFGTGSRPEEFDYLIIPQLGNRVFEVNSVANPDDTLLQYASYYRVMLRDYQDRQMINDENLEEEIQQEVDVFKEMIKSTETELGKEFKEEMVKVRKPLQYNTIGTNELDYVRADIDPSLIIREEKLKNNYTVISKYNYDFTSIPLNNVGLTYRYTDGIYPTENRALTFWIKPSFMPKTIPNILIIDVNETSDGYVDFLTEEEHNYNTGDIIRITGTTDYNGIHTVTRSESFSFGINIPYKSDILINPRSKMLTVNKFLIAGNNNSENLNIMYGRDAFFITINDVIYTYDLKDNGVLLDNGIWYGVTINMSNEFNQMSVFIWKTNPNNGRVSLSGTSGLLPVYNSTSKLNSLISINEGISWQLLGHEGSFTNFRIFTQPIEEEQQSLVLSQYIVIDSHLSVLCDNAIPGIRLDKKTNPR